MDMEIDFIDRAVMDPFAFCDCKYFVEDLINLSYRILAEGNKTELWDMFERFLVQYSRNNPRTSTMYGGIYTIYPCSQKFCIALLNKLEEIKLNLEVSTPIFFVITAIYSSADDVCCYDERNIENLRRFSQNSTTVQIGIALRGKLKFMKLLMNFGLVSSLPDKSVFMKEELVKIIQHFIFINTRADAFNSESVARDILKLAKYAFFRYMNRNCCKRIFLAAIAIRATLYQVMELHSLAEESINCLRMYFTATEDPYLTVFEVRSLLYSCFTQIKKLRLFDGYCQIFDVLMPECSANLNPRKLTDLARCQIRKSLSNSDLLLPAATERLRLPKKLKRFISGDVSYISRNSENEASERSITRAQLDELVS